MRLLFVEDEEDLRLAVKLVLGDRGFAVDTAEDGVEGLYKALNWDYDAIVLDIMMPNMDGWEMLEKLRAQKDTPVLMLTARGEIDDRVKGLNLGSDDYLVKPFDMAELDARLRALIRRTSGKATSRITFGELELDTADKTVRVKGELVRFTAVEYAVLEYLMLNSEKVVTRTDLYEHVFDENDDSMSNNVDVHICNVRKKIGGEQIKTRRGQGYILEA